MKTWKVHYLNKYPGGSVESSDSSFKVYNGKGKLVVALEKGGDGMMHDKSEEYGLEDRHDLSPIPKDSRVHKVVNGKIGRDELADEREDLRAEFERDGKILSCEELQKEGFSFDEKQRVMRRPDASQEIAGDEGDESKPVKKGSKKKAK